MGIDIINLSSNLSATDDVSAIQPAVYIVLSGLELMRRQKNCKISMVLGAVCLLKPSVKHMS